MVLNRLIYFCASELVVEEIKDDPHHDNDRPDEPVVEYRTKSQLALSVNLMSSFWSMMDYIHDHHRTRLQGQEILRVEAWRYVPVGTKWKLVPAGNLSDENFARLSDEADKFRVIVVIAPTDPESPMAAHGVATQAMFDVLHRRVARLERIAHQ